MAEARVIRTLFVGASGQVGRACIAAAPAGIEVFCPPRATLDITDERGVLRVVAGYRPDVIVNSAAYTAVDQAESEPDVAYRVNASGPAYLAAAAREARAFMIQLSTDYVFEGNATTPYTPDAATLPLSVYGASKLRGEQAVQQVLGEHAAILRTSWVYSAAGNNFVTNMLRLMSQGEVRMVSDKIGAPTLSTLLARVIWRIAQERVSGTFHWSDAGTASRYDIALAVAEYARQLGLLPESVRVLPVSTSQFPAAARRPAYSVLDTTKTRERFGLEASHWRVALRNVIEEIRGS